jgi:hypothetical protein
MSLKRIRIPIPSIHALLTTFIALCFLALSLALPAPFPARAAVNQVYLPSVTKALAGWTTPIVVQNTGAGVADVTITFYRVSDGKLATTANIPGLKPGQSVTFDPRTNPQLPSGAQFSAVLESTGGKLAATVIEGNGSSWMSYGGTSTGAATVYLPNITRNLGGADGWNTPFFVQNVGDAPTTASVSFHNFNDGSLAKKIDGVKLEPGRSQAFSPATIDGLPDDRQFAVVVQGPQGSQLYAISNEISGNLAMSYEGMLSGSDMLFLPNILKYLGGDDHWFTPFIVQNLGSTPATISIEFYSFESGALVTQMSGQVLQPGRSLPVDVRFTPSTLPWGSYSVVVRGQPGSQLGTVVNEVDPGAGMAMSYDGIARSQALPSVYLPFLQKNVGAVAWFSPIIAQNLGQQPTDITLTLFDTAGTVAAQKTFTAVKPGAAAVYDPRSDRHLPNGTYSGLVQSQNTNIGAVVNVASTQTGDYAMAYNGTAGPQTAIPTLAPTTKQVGPYTFTLKYGNAADIYVETTIDAATVARAVAQADADVVQVQQDFARSFKTYPTIYLFGSTPSYVQGLQTLGKYTPEHAQQIADNTDALFQPLTQLVFANWSEMTKYQPASVLRHELTHYMDSQIIGTNPTMPAWLDEGLAVNEELTMVGSKWIAMTSRYTTASAAATGTLMPLGTLASPTLWSTRTSPASYFQYYEATEAVRMLRADLGNAGVLRILELMGTGQPFEAAYETVAGRPFSEFVVAFPDRAKALAPVAPGIATAEDSPSGPGLSFIAYGFAPASAIVVEIRSSTTGDMVAELTSFYGTRFHYLMPSWPAGSYNITVTSPATTISVVARKNS